MKRIFAFLRSPGFTVLCGCLLLSGACGEGGEITPADSINPLQEVIATAGDSPDEPTCMPSSQLDRSHDGWNLNYCLRCHDGETTMCRGMVGFPFTCWDDCMPCHSDWTREIAVRPHEDQSDPSIDWGCIDAVVDAEGESSCVGCHGENTLW